MLFYTLGQSAAFLLMIPAGLTIGLIWDGLYLMRRLLEPGFILTLALDLGFSMTSAALFGLGLFRALYGEMRLYAVMGALCGFLIYTGTLSPLLRRLMSAGVRLLKRFIRALLRLKITKRLLR